MKCLMCGDCCISFEIAELDKPKGVRCKYLTDENRCSVHGTELQPKVCWKHDYPSAVCPIGLKKLKDTNMGNSKEFLGFM